VNESSLKEIGVAIVGYEDRVLVGVRGEGVPLSGYAEFPGGKCEPGEVPAACACRECLEESGLEVLPVRCVSTETHEYPHGRVRLHFWLCEPVNVTSVRTRHNGFFWVPRCDLSRWRFPAGNQQVVELLTNENPSPKGRKADSTGD
jgi:8-oxo-dGTP diphosphatase